MAIIGSFLDVLYLDIEEEHELDIDSQYGVADIKSIINHKRKFYILANKKNRLLGYYLIEIDECDP